MNKLWTCFAALALTGAAYAQDIDVSSQPVRGLIRADDVADAVIQATSNKTIPLSELVQKCYFSVARSHAIGSIDGAEDVASCVELDMVGVVLNELAAPHRNAYFASPEAQNRMGTELISFAGLNTHQAYLTINWLKSFTKPAVTDTINIAVSNADADNH
jgi:hypothetical protein